MTQTADRVRKIISDILELRVDQITDETIIVSETTLDSLDQVELVMELEEIFHIEIPENAAENAKTVGDLIRLVESIVGDV